ncbi:MAG: helix-turn-helix domain-containing protein [Planctomycetota bacterium]
MAAVLTPDLADLAARYALAPWAAQLLAELRPLSTQKELAELLRVTPRTVRAWEAGGRLTGASTAPGGRRLYPRESVARLLSTVKGAVA